MENNNKKEKPWVIDEIEDATEHLKKIVAESGRWTGITTSIDLIISRVDDEYEITPRWRVWQRWYEDGMYEDLACADWYVNEDTYKALLDYPHEILKIGKAKELMKYWSQYVG
jgi:hypothetical protein